MGICLESLRVIDECGTVAFLLSRPGSARMTDGDRCWARELSAAAVRVGVRLQPIHLATDEALRKVSGVHARGEEGFGLRPNIGIRGLLPTRSSKVLLLEDGIPLSYAPYGDNASYYHPPIDRFESVEVIKGAGQVLYGPMTVGGVINYITPAAPDRRGGYVVTWDAQPGTYGFQILFADQPVAQDSVSLDGPRRVVVAVDQTGAVTTATWPKRASCGR